MECTGNPHFKNTFKNRTPPWGPGASVGNVSSVSPACRKRRLIGAVRRNHHIKRLVRVGVWMGTLKNPTKCLWRWEPDRRSHYFFSPPAHLCAVTCMTEISLIVTSTVAYLGAEKWGGTNFFSKKVKSKNQKKKKKKKGHSGVKAHDRVFWIGE